ncbi:hypothetical protein WJN01_01830 [Flavobacteriaceae bacterium SZ-1-7]|uniref:hypothetical protein n=1 Tax=Tamlana sedimenti TaxID=3134126 RepID=UPI0031293F70
MTKKVFCLLVMLLSLSAFPNSMMATEKPPVHATIKTTEIPPEIKIMMDRLYEIKEMDKSNLNRDEKKELREEVRTIKKTVRASGNGIYISSGAIIIILLLIIIL